MIRRGFTILELSMATVIGAFVVLVCLGMMASFERTDRALSARYADTQTLWHCHATLRWAMQSLVAMPQTTTRPGQPAAAAEEPPPPPAGSADTPRGAGGALNAAPPEPMLIIGPILETGETAGSGMLPGEFPWRIEVVLTEAPIASLRRTHSGPVRGAFEIIRDWYDERDWVFQWRPIVPEGEPIELAHGLAAGMMAVLPRDSPDYVYALEATELNTFPRAIRVVLLTRGGASTDWLFEPGLTIGASP